MGAEEEGARRAVVVAREVYHRRVLLPWLQRSVAGCGGGGGPAVGFRFRASAPVPPPPPP